MITDKLLYFDRLASFLPIDETLTGMLETRYPEITVEVSKNQISLRNRYVFAAVSLPERRRKNWPKEYLLITFGLGYKKESPRIALSVEPYSGRFTHHVIVEREEQLDAELLG